MRNLSCIDIIAAVQKYEQGNRIVDAAVKKALGKTGDTLTKVTLVGSWGAIQRGRGLSVFQQFILLSKALDNAADAIASLTQTRDKWLEQPSIMDEAITVLQKCGLTPIEFGGKPRNMLNMVSKYLSLCVSDSFPIIDGNARKAAEFKCPAMFVSSWDEYRLWCGAVREQVNEHIGCCLYHVGLDESPVRTMDKALYILGG